MDLHFSNICDDRPSVFPHRIVVLHGTVSLCRPSIASFSFSNKTTNQRCPLHHVIGQGSNSLAFTALIELALGTNQIEVTAAASNDANLSDVSKQLSLIYQPVSLPQTLIKLVYYIPADENASSLELAGVKRRLILGLELLQAILSNEIFAKFGERRTFSICTESSFNVLRSTKTQVEFTKESLDYWTVVKDCIDSGLLPAPSFESYHETAFKLVVIVRSQNCHTASTIQHSTCTSQACGDVALISDAGLDQWPEALASVQSHLLLALPSNHNSDHDLSSKQLALSSLNPDHVIKERGYSWHVGAMLHELCHSFGLGHYAAGIMGPDFDKVTMETLLPQLNSLPNLLDEADLHILYWHRAFNPKLEHSQSSSSLRLIAEMNVIASDCGISLIQLRRNCDGFVLKSIVFNEEHRPKFWRLDGLTPKSSGHLNEDSQSEKGGDIAVFAYDTLGNCLRVIVSS